MNIVPLFTKVKEVKEIEDINEVNSLVKENWILLHIVSNENKVIYSMGRI